MANKKNQNQNQPKRTPKQMPTYNRKGVNLEILKSMFESGIPYRKLAVYFDVSPSLIDRYKNQYNWKKPNRKYNNKYHDPKTFSLAQFLSSTEYDDESKKEAIKKMEQNRNSGVKNIDSLENHSQHLTLVKSIPAEELNLETILTYLDNLIYSHTNNLISDNNITSNLQNNKQIKDINNLNQIQTQINKNIEYINRIYDSFEYLSNLQIQRLTKYKKHIGTYIAILTTCKRRIDRGLHLTTEELMQLTAVYDKALQGLAWLKDKIIEENSQEDDYEYQHDTQIDLSTELNKAQRERQR